VAWNCTRNMLVALCPEASAQAIMRSKCGLRGGDFGYGLAGVRVDGKTRDELFTGEAPKSAKTRRKRRDWKGWGGRSQGMDWLNATSAEEQRKLVLLRSEAHGRKLYLPGNRPRINKRHGRQISTSRGGVQPPITGRAELLMAKAPVRYEKEQLELYPKAEAADTGPSRRLW